MNRLLLIVILCFSFFTCVCKEHTKVEVKGRVIDIRVAYPSYEAFPQNKQLKFDKSLPKFLHKKQYAVSLKEFEDPIKVRASHSIELIVAMSGLQELDTLIWKATGDFFI